MEYSEISGKSEMVDKLAYKLRLIKNRKVKFCKLDKDIFLKIHRSLQTYNDPEKHSGSW